MILDDKNIKSIVKYGLLIIIPLIVASILLFCYNLYISLIRKINEVGNGRPLSSQRSTYTRENGFAKNIKRLSFLKYTHQNGKGDESIYLIEIVKIGNCKYIIVSKKDQDPIIIHANDCDNSIHKN